MKRLLLLGGGHAHALVLRELRKAKLAGVAVTLVSPYPVHTYSGMLPGHIAGHYSSSELQIDLARIAREAGARLVLDGVSGLNPKEKSASLRSGGALPYDLVSLNLGSVPEATVPGAEFAVAAKPFEKFIARWNKEGMKSRRIAVVGAGAGGVELAMAMRHRRSEAKVVLFSDRPMFSGWLGTRIQKALARCGVDLRQNVAVARVERGPAIVTDSGTEAFDFVVWTTGAAPQSWLRQSGLTVDGKGFVLVDETLRSVSHPEVFAAGDSATLQRAPHPKSGVYAVRHAPVLLENLRGVFEGRTLSSYMPQAKQLALISCGEKYGIASRGGWSAEGRWAWRWKDWLDRRWIGRFR